MPSLSLPARPGFYHCEELEMKNVRYVISTTNNLGQTVYVTKKCGLTFYRRRAWQTESYERCTEFIETYRRFRILFQKLDDDKILDNMTVETMFCRAKRRSS